MYKGEKVHKVQLSTVLGIKFYLWFSVKQHFNGYLNLWMYSCDHSSKLILLLSTFKIMKISAI